MTTRSLLPIIAISTLLLGSCSSADTKADSYRIADSMSSGNYAYAPGVEENTLDDRTGLYQESSAVADSLKTVLKSSAASITRLDSTHMFVRTADVRCRVKEVADATYSIEKSVRDLGGYVNDTRLTTTQNWRHEVRTDPDSIKRSSSYSVGNNIIIRIPARNLDSLLSALAPLVEYMDYRNVNVNDITLEQLSKQLEQKRLATYNAMLQSKVVDQNVKPDKLMNAADAMLARQEQSDNAYLESLRLNDKVEFATLNLQLYQPEVIATSMIFIEEPQPPYTASIGSRLLSSLEAGWTGFSYFLSGIVLLWPLWLIGGITWYIVRRWQRRRTTTA